MINRYIDIFITSLSSNKIKQYKLWLLCEQISYFKGMATPLQNSKVRTFPVDASWNNIEIPQHDVHALYKCIYIPTYSCIMIVAFTRVHEGCIVENTLTKAKVAAALISWWTQNLEHPGIMVPVWVDPHVIHNHCCKGDLLTKSTCIYIYIYLSIYM